MNKKKSSICIRSGSLVKRLRRRPLTAESGVRFPYELLSLFFRKSLHLAGCGVIV